MELTQIIIAIAQLCSVTPHVVDYTTTSTFQTLSQSQLKCQQDYVNCVQQNGNNANALASCIKQKTIK